MSFALKIQVFLIFIFLMDSFLIMALPCDYKVEIIANGTIFQKDEFSWKIRAIKIEGPSTSITGNAQIQTDGKIVKSYKPWTNETISKQKTSSKYSPNLVKGTYKIAAWINVTCDDTNLVDNEDYKIVGIIDAKEPSEEIPDEGAPTISQQVQDQEINQSFALQEQDKTENKATETPLITANAAKEMPNETLLDSIQDNVIELHKEKYEPKAVLKNDQNFQAYNSSSEKSKELVLYLFLGLSIILNIVLIWKR